MKQLKFELWIRGKDGKIVRKYRLSHLNNLELCVKQFEGTKNSAETIGEGV